MPLRGGAASSKRCCQKERPPWTIRDDDGTTEVIVAGDSPADDQVVGNPYAAFLDGRAAVQRVHAVKQGSARAVLDSLLFSVQRVMLRATDWPVVNHRVGAWRHRLAALALGDGGRCAAGVRAGCVVHDAVHRLRKLRWARRHHQRVVRVVLSAHSDRYTQPTNTSAGNSRTTKLITPSRKHTWCSPCSPGIKPI